MVQEGRGAYLIVVGYNNTESTALWTSVAAACVGLVMGGVQSLSRSTYSKFLPEHAIDTASYFSFYDVSEKIGIVIGMFSYGFIAELTGDIRYSIITLTVYFLIGIILLLRIPKALG